MLGEGRAAAWSIRRITHATGMLRPLRAPQFARAVSHADVLARPYGERRDIARSAGASRSEKSICGQAKASRTIYVIRIALTIT